MGKSGIYKKYGVSYKNGKVKMPVPWTWYINPLLKNGNGKVCTPSKEIDTETAAGIKAATFGIMHGCETIDAENVSDDVRRLMDYVGISSIKGSCPCHCGGCYVDSGNYNFPENVTGRQIRYILAAFFPEWTAAVIMAQIEADGIRQIRIHDAGDFFSDRYLAMWIDIIETFRDVIFWTYTKNDAAVDAFDKLPNAFITPSITPYGVNYGTCGYILKLYAALTRAGYAVHICGCGTPYEKHCDRCDTGCKAIGNGVQYVLFIMHSVKGYRAGRDDAAEYAAVCEIVRNQDN